ncbi:MAG TPA: PilZ domain-containing protein [Terracidiphilus sp.]|nr:PilZ domain-containing protein [Terracidiphilus sp.]
MTRATQNPAEAGHGKESPQHEQRVHPRLRCKGIAELRVLPVGGVAVGALFDLSKKGCCILSDVPIPAFEHSNVEVHLKIKGMSLRVAGVVRHVHGQTRAGIEFLEVSARKAEQIEELMAELVEMDRSAAWEQYLTDKAQEVD